ncbi:protein FAM171B-like isoform X2 [Hemibagrus wyckioides]|uniref:protein FAM171B-like isoform X2 n=1 Tax=Hemibagrus wyckioides TaxID=337641 RepID=UPI00266CF81E|nr:protein FAM171B-like isoform X2 [Hemibagrus wyckioides]
MDKLIVLLFLLTLFIISKDGRVTAGFKGSALASLTLTKSTQDQLAYRHSNQNHQDEGLTGQKESTFTLRVQVKNAVSHQPVSHATVEVFANYTLFNSTTTSRDGVTVLKVPYTHSWPLMLVARKDGYIQTPLLWKTTKIPIFSSVMLPLFYQNPGNIWLFEDLVVITGKMSDTVPPANVQFPKRLLSLPDSNISSLTAYLTVPRLPAEKHFFPNTTGIIMSKSGYRSVELNPIAAVSVQLLYNGIDVQISGPVQITLPLAESSQSQLSYTVPAWSFDRKIGAWVNRGLGTVQMENRHLVWVYTAPHLDYWIAAPFPSSTDCVILENVGYMGHESTLDFISYNAYLLVPVVGGGLIIAVGLLAVISCYCRESLCKQKRNRAHSRKTSVQKKEQTTGRNNSNEQLDISFKASTSHKHRHRSAAFQSTSASKRDQLELKSKFNKSMGKTGQAEIRIHDNVDKLAQESSKTLQTAQNVNSSELVIPVSLHENVFPESLVLCNQSVALIQVPHHSTSSDQTSGSRSATLPRKAVENNGLEKQANKQTLQAKALLSEVQQQVQTMETPYGQPRAKGWGCLLESVSVPDTLNKTTGADASCGTQQGRSERTLLELSKSNPFPHPKAWFVSLEGKPAAQVFHSIVDLQKCHLQLTDSHETSLDSGVDLYEQHRKQSQSYPKRNAAHTQADYSEDADLSSCESGTIIASTPENTHQSSSRTVSYLPEEKCVEDMSYEGTECAPSPQVQRLKKAREKPKSTWHLREERPLMKLN